MFPTKVNYTYWSIKYFRAGGKKLVTVLNAKQVKVFVYSSIYINLKMIGETIYKFKDDRGDDRAFILPAIFIFQADYTDWATDKLLY